MLSVRSRVITFCVVTMLALSIVGCETTQKASSPAQPESKQLSLDVNPVENRDQWKIATADSVTLTAKAPSARSVKILYRPIVATDRYVVLKTINTATDQRAGTFTTTLKLVPDFAGELWAEASYPDGGSNKTEPIQLAAQSSDVAQSPQGQGTPPPPAGASTPIGSIGNDESPRSDKFTGGKIERT